MDERGLVHVYFGRGKGKTTASLGLALRVLGYGEKVAIVQFMKGSMYAGEIFALSRFSELVDHYKFGWTCPHSALISSGLSKCRQCGRCFRENRNPEHDYAPQALALAQQLAAGGRYRLLVLDEIGNALRRRLVTAAAVAALIDGCCPTTELVLTGRSLPQEIVDKAHLVTEVSAVKHPFQQGVPSRRGIEY